MEAEAEAGRELVLCLDLGLRLEFEVPFKEDLWGEYKRSEYELSLSLSLELELMLESGEEGAGEGLIDVAG